MSKKITFIFLVIFLNYILITLLVFAFSYFSLLNNKTYDLFWIKSIQKKLYFRGMRNIWQYKNNCIEFDKHLFYVPKDGPCEFNNPEFRTFLNFRDGVRLNSNDINFDESAQSIAVIGDSFAMGWGVNDKETFSSKLENKLNKRVYNLGVSSYGTIREVKKLINSDYYKEVDTIIIQYHFNDIDENSTSNISKIYEIEKYNKVFKSNNYSVNKTKYLLKSLKSSLRLFFSDILDKIFPEKNLRKLDFNLHNVYIEKFILENIDYKNKRVILFHVDEPGLKVMNFPKSNEKIEYFNLKLDKSNFFTIDNHLNVDGHSLIANKLYEYLK